MTRKKKTNEAQSRLPETEGITISHASGFDFDWGVDIGQSAPTWGIEKQERSEEKNQGVIKAFVKQASFSGLINSHVIYLDSNSKLWSKFPTKRKTGKTRHKANLTVVK